MSLAEKRYIGQRIGAGTFATTNDVDHGYVNGPLLNGGSYRAQRLASGVYGVGPCHLLGGQLNHPDTRKPGILVASGKYGVNRCALDLNVQAQLFTPGMGLGGLGTYGFYSGNLWFPDGPSILEKFDEEPPGSGWPTELEFRPIGGIGRGGWRRFWPGQIVPDWEVTVAGVNHPVANGTFTFTCGINHSTFPDYCNAFEDIYSGVYSIEYYNPLGDSYHFFNRVLAFPSFYALHYLFGGITPVLTIQGHNSWGDIVRYGLQGAAGETVFPRVSTIFADDWPDNITLTIPFQQTNDPLVFSIASMNDAAMNKTWSLPIIDTSGDYVIWAADNPSLLGILHNGPDWLP